MTTETLTPVEREIIDSLDKNGKLFFTREDIDRLAQAADGKPQEEIEPGPFTVQTFGVYFPRVEASETFGRSKAQFTVENFTNIQTEDVDWLFQGYAAMGQITGLSGEPGQGKSLVAVDWAARFSTGRGWPDGEPALQKPGNVLVFSTEDDAGATIKPRFEHAGGDSKKLFRMRLPDSGGFYLDDPEHLDYLRHTIERYEIGMVIVDPILEHLRVQKEQETRQAFSPLRALLQEHGVCMVMIVHTNKRSADNVGSVGDKVGGVKALVGLPRFVYSVHTTEADGIGHICQIKNNLWKRIKGSLDFRCRFVGPKADIPLIEWLGAGTATASDALRIGTKKDCAAALLNLLKDGDNKSQEIKEALYGLDFTESQVNRAATGLRMANKLEIVKLADRSSVWRKMHPADKVSAQFAGPGEPNRTD